MKQTLYDRIAARLEHLGKSAREVSIAAGLGPDGIRDIKRGRTPSGSRLQAIARELECSLDELLGAAGKPPSDQPPPTAIPELDGLLGAGLGGDATLEAFTTAEGHTVNRDVAVAEWTLPEAYLATELRVRPGAARIMAVVGDSMAPTLLPGDRVMVNTIDRRPSPPGVFALWDGLGIVVKRVEYIPGSDPPAIRILSDNAHHTPYERTLDEANIIGRVVWFSRRM